MSNLTWTQQPAAMKRAFHTAVTCEQCLDTCVLMFGGLTVAGTVFQPLANLTKYDGRSFQPVPTRNPPSPRYNHQSGSWVAVTPPPFLLATLPHSPPPPP